MSKTPSLADMLQAGALFGHRSSRWHPKMARFIFGERSDIHIIDLEKTSQQLAAACAFVKGVASRGGTVLFVGTKRQAQGIIKQAAEACGMPFVNERWLGGTLTNFPQIKLTIKDMLNMKDLREKGELRRYTKKERLLIDRKIEEQEKKIGGIQKMDRVPEAIFVLDVRHDKTAIEEAESVGVKVVAVCDSNVNPTPVDYIIPGNDDAVKSIALFAGVISEAIKDGVAEAASAKAALEVKKSV